MKNLDELRISDCELRILMMNGVVQQQIVESDDCISQSAIRDPQSGYALVSLLVFMSLLALFALAAAPHVLQQAQRGRENEEIFRGQQVAVAIDAYYREFKWNHGIITQQNALVQL